MTSFTVPVTVTINTFPPPGQFITDFTITPDFSSLPAGFLTKEDNKGHFKAHFQSQANPGKITGPLVPGDQVTFNFTANTGFTVVAVPIPAPANLLTWNCRGNPNGTASATAVVTGALVPKGKTHTKYSLTIKQASSNSTRDIDPDFETELT